MAITLRRLNSVGEPEIEQLADVTTDCVEGGASIRFPEGGCCSMTYVYRELSA